MLTTEQRVKIALIEKGIRQVDLERLHGIDKGDLSKVIAGKRRTKKIRAIVANAVGKSVEELFITEILATNEEVK